VSSVCARVQARAIGYVATVVRSDAGASAAFAPAACDVLMALFDASACAACVSAMVRHCRLSVRAH
jgi:hypothetical protein